MNLENRGDICSCIISAVGMQLFNSFSEKCRTPGECRIQRHGLFCAPKAISFVEPLKWCVLLRGIQYHAT